MSDKSGTSILDIFENPKAKALFEKYKMPFPLDKNKTDYYISSIDSGSKSNASVLVYYYRISNIPNLFSYDNTNNVQRKLRINLEKHPIHIRLANDGGVIKSTFIIDQNTIEPPVIVNYLFDDSKINSTTLH